MIGILGAGESGVSAALLAKQVGEEPFLSDFAEIDAEHKEEIKKKNIRFEEGGHSLDILIGTTSVIKSPGIPGSAFIVKSLKERGIEVISELEFAYRHALAPIVAITGSNGKTTTTNLIHHVLKEGGMKVIKGGNLGRSFSRLIVEEEIPEYYVLEVSSFQLDDIRKFKPVVSVILNITPDHLDRYGGQMDLYARSKMRIAVNQEAEDWLFVNAHDQWTRKMTAVSKIRATIDWIGEDELAFDAFKVDNVYLRGMHNALNASFAIEVARLFGIDDEVIAKALHSFTNDAHRMQVVGVIDGVEWINDSKATNVDAVIFALKSLDRPIVWIAGGVDKGNNYDDFDEMSLRNVKTLICMGLENEKLKTAFAGRIEKIVETRSMHEAVNKAGQYAKKGDAVLLSPACASFDLFENYKARGNQFMEAIWKRLE